MMKRVVHRVVPDVEEERAGNDGVRDERGEDGVGEFREGRLEGDEEGRGHDEAKAVHGDVVVDAVEEEVGGEGDAVVREVLVDVEKEAVHAVFEDLLPRI